MIPFRVYDKSNKMMWMVLNYHPDSKGEGSYLLARDDDSDDDGAIEIMPAKSLKSFQLVGFLEHSEE